MAQVGEGKSRYPRAISGGGGGGGAIERRRHGLRELRAPPGRLLLPAPTKLLLQLGTLALNARVADMAPSLYHCCCDSVRGGLASEQQRRIDARYVFNRAKCVELSCCLAGSPH